MSQCPCHTVYLTCCRSDAVNTWHDTTIRGSHGRRCRACCPALWVVVDTVQVDDHIVRKHLQRPGGIRGAVDQLVVGVDKRWSPVSIRCCMRRDALHVHTRLVPSCRRSCTAPAPSLFLERAHWCRHHYLAIILLQHKHHMLVNGICHKQHPWKFVLSNHMD